MENRRHAVAVAENVKNSILGFDWGGSSLSGFLNPFDWLSR